MTKWVLKLTLLFMSVEEKCIQILLLHSNIEFSDISTKLLLSALETIPLRPLEQIQRTATKYSLHTYTIQLVTTN